MEVRITESKRPPRPPPHSGVCHAPCCFYKHKRSREESAQQGDTKRKRLQIQTVCQLLQQMSPANQRDITDQEEEEEGLPKQEPTDEAQTEQAVMAGEALERRNIWEPSVYYSLGKESFHFAGHDITIRESIDSYGALIWPGAVALCQFLENNQRHVNLMDKAVLEIGAGTGLLSVVAGLLGAWVTATDLPEILPNLTFNLLRNTKGRARYTPQVAALTWGQHLERDFPQTSYHYDYVLAADVVYPHNCLQELLDTMRHFCRAGSRTTLLWANKVRFESDLRFTDRFKSSFDATLLVELPQQEVRIYQATARA